MHVLYPIYYIMTLCDQHNTHDMYNVHILWWLIFELTKTIPILTKTFVFSLPIKN